MWSDSKWIQPLYHSKGLRVWRVLGFLLCTCIQTSYIAKRAKPPLHVADLIFALATLEDQRTKSVRWFAHTKPMVSIEQKAKISEGLVQDEYRYLVHSDEVVLVKLTGTIFAIIWSFLLMVLRVHEIRRCLTQNQVLKMRTWSGEFGLGHFDPDHFLCKKRYSRYFSRQKWSWTKCPQPLYSGKGLCIWCVFRFSLCTCVQNLYIRT